MGAGPVDDVAGNAAGLTPQEYCSGDAAGVRLQECRGLISQEFFPFED